MAITNPRTEPLRIGWMRAAAVSATLLAAACAPVAGTSAGGGTSAPTQVATEGAVAVPLGVGGGIDSIVGSFLAGRHAEAVNDIGAAADFMATVLDRDPANMDLLRRTFLLRAAGGDLDAALPLARRVIEQDPQAPIANMLVAIEEVRGGDEQAAARRLEALPARGINRMMVPLLVAWIRDDERGPDAALKALEPLAEVRALAATYQLHKGLINDLAERPEVALEAYRAAMEANTNPALRLVQALGSRLARSGQPDAARAIYDAYETRHPASELVRPDQERLAAGAAADIVVGSPRAGLAEALFGAAGGLYRQGETHMALIFAHLALRLRPAFPIARVMIADIFESLGRLEQAIAIYDDIGKASVFRWQSRLRVVNDLAELDRTDEAIERLDAMAAERPRSYDPLFQKGNLLRREERFAEAAAAYDQAMARVDKIEPRHWALFYARGIALERSQQWPRAEADLLKALELRPDQPYVLNYLGYSWADQGVNLDRAQRMIERAVELRPNDGFIVDSLGWVLYRRGDLKGAVKQLERAIELMPEDPAINDHLGDAFWRVGRRNEARFQWRRALSLETNPELSKVIEDKLKHGLRDTDRAASGA